MITFLVCVGLVLTGIFMVYNKGRLGTIGMSGLIESKEKVYHVELSNVSNKEVETRVALTIKIDQVDDPKYRTEFIGQTVKIIVPAEDFDLIKEGDRTQVSLNRFVSPNGKTRDSFSRTEASVSISSTN